jgi:hypothetical protein
MLIGYGMPAVSAPTFTGAGAAWLSADNGTAMFDRKPGRRTRMRWLSSATPSIAHVLMIAAPLAAPIRPRIVGVLGLKGVPEGVSVMVAGKRPSDGAHVYTMGGGNTGVTRKMADGSIGCWFVVGEGADEITSLAVDLYNNAGGSTWATAATEIEIGEVVVFKAVTVGLADGWGIGRVDPSIHQRTRGGQLSTVAATSYRRFTGTLAGAATAAVRGGGLANGEDWETVAAALTGGARCVVIPQYRTLPGGVFDAALCNRTALYGIALEVPGPQNIQRQYFSGTMTVEEIPA